MNRTEHFGIRKFVFAFIAIASLFSSAVADSQSAPPPILLGTAWYPEQWPESRWEADLMLMEQAGIHMVRVGEFAWSSMEPREGQYDLDWLERAVAMAGKHGIYTVIGTPGRSSLPLKGTKEFVRGSHAASCILKSNHNLLIFDSGRDSHLFLLAGFHRPLTVSDKVQECLHESIAVGGHQRQVIVDTPN